MFRRDTSGNMDVLVKKRAVLNAKKKRNAQSQVGSSFVEFAGNKFQSRFIHSVTRF